MNFRLASLIAASALCFAGLIAPAAAQSSATLGFTINRSAVSPSIYYTDLTLKIFVGTATVSSVTGDGNAIAADKYAVSNGYLIVNTRASALSVSLTNITSTAGLGTFTKAVFKNDKLCAWTWSGDDNVNFDNPTIPALSAHNYVGLLYLITEPDSAPIDQIANDGMWHIGPSQIGELLGMGWDIGNHSKTHPNYPATYNSAEILDAQTMLTTMTTAAKPGYKVNAFANPYFDGGFDAMYTAAKSTTSILFHETGGTPCKIIMDDNAAQLGEFTPFNPDASIGRLWLSDDNVADFEGAIDIAATISDATHHLWINSFHHGWETNHTRFAESVDYIYNNYGAGGSDILWQTTSAQLWSYAHVRKNAAVTYTGTTYPASLISISSVTANPKTITVGTAANVTVTATVTGGTPASATINLSKIGASAITAMTVNGSTLTATFSVPASSKLGAKELGIIAKDANNNVALASAFVSVCPVPVAVPPYMLYTDAESHMAPGGWEGAGTGGHMTGTEISTGAYEGSKCVQMDYQTGGWWAAEVTSINGWAGINMAKYDTIQFAWKTTGTDDYYLVLGFSDQSKTSNGDKIAPSSSWTIVKRPMNYWKNVLDGGIQPASVGGNGTAKYADKMTNVASLCFAVGGHSDVSAGKMFYDDVRLISAGPQGTVTIPVKVQAVNTNHGLKIAANGSRMLNIETANKGTIKVFELRGTQIGSMNINASSPASLKVTNAGTYVIRFEGIGSTEIRKVIVR